MEDQLIPMSNLKHSLPLIPLFSAAHAARWETAASRHRLGMTRGYPSAPFTFTDRSRFDALEVSTARKAGQWAPLVESAFESEHPDAMVSAGGHHQIHDERDDVGESSESAKSDESVEKITVLPLAESVGNSKTVPSNQTNSRTRYSTSNGSRRKKSSGTDAMTVRTYTWVTLWFLLTAPVIFWDASYCFMRPRSMVGGDLHWIWEPYGLYQEIDYVYGIKALEENNGFTNAQSLLNLVETVMNLAYVFLAHVPNWPGAPVIGFAAATMTLSKTVLYWANEYYCGGCSIGHNSWPNLVLYWIIPNGIWLVFPSMIVWRLGKDLTNSLSVASKSSTKAASGKAE